MRYNVLNILGRLGSVTCVGAALLAGGCSSFSHPYPEKALFAIVVGKPNGATASAGTSAAETRPARRPASVLRVRGMRMAEPFDTTSFVYKVGESKFTTDYYNGFIADPGRLLSGELLKWLSASGDFGSLVEEGSTTDYHLTLESHVTELYGDYTDRRSPQAVMELKVFLIDDMPSASEVIFQQTYRETQPLPGNTPENLVRGWEEAYRRILTRLLSDLRASPRVANAGIGSQSR